MSPLSDENIIGRIFKKLDELHNNIDKINTSITEIKQWKKDMDSFEESNFNSKIAKRDRIFGAAGIIIAILAIALTFI